MKLVPKRQRRRERRTIGRPVIFALLLVLFFLGGYIMATQHVFRNVLGSAGFGGASQGSASNQAPVIAKGGLSPVPVVVSAGKLKLGVIAPANEPYGFINVGASGLIPGQTISRVFAVENVGTVPIGSVSISIQLNGSPAIEPYLSLLIERCADPAYTSCQPLTQQLSGTAMNISTPIYAATSGSLTTGQEAYYELVLSFASNAPNSAQGQTAQLDYTLTAVQAQ